MAFHAVCTKAHTHTYKHTVCLFRFNFIYGERNEFEQERRRLKAGAGVVCQFQSTVHTSECMYVCVLAHYGLAQSMSLSISIFLASSVHVMLPTLLLSSRSTTISFYRLHAHVFLHTFCAHQHELMIVKLN